MTSEGAGVECQQSVKRNGQTSEEQATKDSGESSGSKVGNAENTGKDVKGGGRSKER